MEETCQCFLYSELTFIHIYIQVNLLAFLKFLYSFQMTFIL
jgi:hypothetical protein